MLKTCLSLSWLTAIPHNTFLLHEQTVATAFWLLCSHSSLAEVRETDDGFSWDWLLVYVKALWKGLTISNTRLLKRRGRWQVMRREDFDQGWPSQNMIKDSRYLAWKRHLIPPQSTRVWLPASALASCFQHMQALRGSGGDSSNWVPATHMGDLEWFLAPEWPWLRPECCGYLEEENSIWELSLYVYLPQKILKIKEGDDKEIISSLLKNTVSL